MRLQHCMTGTFLLLFSTALVAQQGPPPGQERPGQERERELPRGLLFKTDSANEGFTLFSPLRSETTHLINLDGEVVHEWVTDCSPGNSAYLQDNGDLIRCGRVENDVFQGGGQGGKVQRWSWEGELLWDLDLSTNEMLAHHDIEVLPNGHLLVIAWEYKSAAAARGAGRVPEQISSTGFWPDMVLEYRVGAEGEAEVVWEWHSFDHLIQDHDEAVSNFGDVSTHPELIDINGDHYAESIAAKQESEQEKMQAEQRKRELEERMRALGYTGDDEEDEDDEEDAEEANTGPRSGDWLHINGIHYDAANDIILLSVRTMNEVWVIDHSTTTAEAKTHKGGRYKRGGDLLYRFGNSFNFDRSPESKQRLFKQHDARWLGPVEGGLSVLVFNNGEGRDDPAFTSVDEFVLPFTSKEGFGQERPTLKWSYKAEEPTSFFASFVSGAQRLPNGNTLICDGVQGHIFEVTPAGSTVWSYKNPFAGEQPVMMGGGGRNGRRRGDGPPNDGPPNDGPPNGGPPNGGPPNGGPPNGGPPNGGPPNGDRAQHGGGRELLRYGMFRATRISEKHPGLAGREL